jgi:hypothetical protein
MVDLTKNIPFQCTKHSRLLSPLPIRAARPGNGRERCTDICLIPYRRDKQKDAYVKRDPGKNLSKVEAKAREKSKTRMARREESGPKQLSVVTAAMVDKKKVETFQVGRDTKTGRFMTVKAAKRRTKTAVGEMINKKK